MKLWSADAAYEKDGKIYSAFQNHEVVEFDTETKEIKVIETWADYKLTKEKVKEFNKEQRENTSSR